MKLVLKFELRRAFCNRMFFVALALGCAITVAHIFITVIPSVLNELEMWKLYGVGKGAYPPSLFHSWLGGRGNTLEINLYFLLLPLIICIPHADTIFSDRSRCYLRNLAQRTDLKKYYTAKLVSVFLSAGCVAVAPLVLNLFLTSLFFPAVQPIPAAGTFPILANGMWAEIFYATPFLYLFMYFILVFLFCGLLSLLVFPFSSLVSNRVLALLSPFILCVFFDFLLTILSPDLATFSPLSTMRPDQPVVIDFLCVLAEFVILGSAIVGLAVYKAGRDEVY